MAGFLSLLRVRLELFTVEAHEEVLRLGELLLLGVLAVAFFSLGVGFFSVLITVALWDSHRLLALAIFSTGFLVLAAVAAVGVRRKFRQGTQLFAASLQELQQDESRLRS